MQRRVHKKQKLLEGNLGDHFSYQFGERFSFFRKRIHKGKNWVIYINILTLVSQSHHHQTENTNDKMLLVIEGGIHKSTHKVKP